jgi:hypothetical protein
VSDIVADAHFMVLKGLLYSIYLDGNKFVWNSIQENITKEKIINDNLKIFKTRTAIY